MKKKHIMSLLLSIMGIFLIAWSYRDSVRRSNQAADKAIVNFKLLYLESKLKRYKKNHEEFPASLADIEVDNPDSLMDPWGRPFLYRLETLESFPVKYGFTLKTYGADGVPGGHADNEDISRVFARSAELSAVD